MTDVYNAKAKVEEILRCSECDKQLADDQHPVQTKCAGCDDYFVGDADMVCIEMEHLGSFHYHQSCYKQTILVGTPEEIKASMERVVAARRAWEEASHAYQKLIKVEI